VHPAPDGKYRPTSPSKSRRTGSLDPQDLRTGPDPLYEGRIRWIRCRSCQSEFSERKNTPLWNSKIGEGKAITIADPANPSLGFHDQRVQQLTSTSLQADSEQSKEVRLVA